MAEAEQKNIDNPQSDIQQASAYLVHCVGLLEEALAKKSTIANDTLLAQKLKKSEEARQKLEAANKEVAQRLIHSMEMLRNIMDIQE